MSKPRKYPSGVSIAKTTNGTGTVYWRVRLGKRYTGGSIIRKDCQTERAAKEWFFGEDSVSADKRRAMPGTVVELKKAAGSAAFALNANQLNEAAWAFQKLGKIKLTEVVEFYLAHARPEAGAKKLSEVIVEHLRAVLERGGSPTYHNAQRISCELLQRDLNDPIITTVSAEAIEEVANRKKWKPLNKRNYFRDWSMLFNFALRREYIAKNPLSKVDRPRVKTEIPEIYTVAESRSLLVSARDHYPELLGFIAIGLFAGVRVEELKRMTWEMVHLEEEIISLPGWVAKGGAKGGMPRDIEVSANLTEWLMLCKPRTGPLSPTSALRSKLDGLYEKADSRKRNALRHSFASYFLVKTKSPERTQLNLGQQTPSVLFKHYRQVVKAADAAAYWDIRPGNVEGVAGIGALSGAAQTSAVGEA